MSGADVKQAWGKVADELSGLGLKLKYHVEEEFAEDEDGEEVKAAAKRVADAIEDTVDAIGNAAKDEAVREDVKDAGKRFAEALSVSVDEAARTFRQAVGRD